DLLKLWPRHAGRLTGINEAAPLKQEIERWRARVEACDLFLQALAAGHERDIARTWHRLVLAGGHPDAEPHGDRASLAKKRGECLDRLERMDARLPADEQ